MQRQRPHNQAVAFNSNDNDLNARIDDDSFAFRVEFLTPDLNHSARRKQRRRLAVLIDEIPQTLLFFLERCECREILRTGQQLMSQCGLWQDMQTESDERGNADDHAGDVAPECCQITRLVPRLVRAIHRSAEAARSQNRKHPGGRNKNLRCDNAQPDYDQQENHQSVRVHGRPITL